MPDDWPVLPLFAFLFVVAFCRAGATYAIGRGLRGTADQRSDLLDRPAVRRADAAVRRYGPWAVTLCFLTVGVQTAVNAAAGALRMPVRLPPALAAGALIWATIYVTIGLAVIGAFWGGASGRLLTAVFAALVLLVVVGRLVRRRILARAAEAPPGSGEPEA